MRKICTNCGEYTLKIQQDILDWGCLWGIFHWRSPGRCWAIFLQYGSHGQVMAYDIQQVSVELICRVL